MAYGKRAWIGRALAAVLALSLGAARTGGSQTIAQTTAEANPDTTAALHEMARLAGVIFAGRVTAVRRQTSNGIVEIDFAVDDPVRGTVGSTYTLREWAGLWLAGDEPFRVGQRYLMLLHAPAASGLRLSPVGGADGAIPIVGGLAGRTDNRAVDLRWVATRAVRQIVYRLRERPTGLPASAHPDAVLMDAAPAEESESANAAPPIERASYAAVLATLRSWQKDTGAAR